MVKLKIAKSGGGTGTLGIPMHERSKIGIFINRKNVSYKVKEFSFTDVENEIATVDMTFPRYAVESTDLARGNYVVIMYDTKVLGVGTIEQPEYVSKGDFRLFVRLFGEGGKKLTKSILAKEDYVDIDSDTVQKNLLSESLDGIAPWILQPDTMDGKGGTTIRIDNTNRWDVLVSSVKELGLHWRMSYPVMSGDVDYHEDERFNVYDWDDPKKYPEKHSPHIPAFTSENTNLIRKQEDETQAINYVRLLGSGDGETQLESIQYHATLKRSRLSKPMDTWLTSDVAIGATTIDVTNTEGFPSSGSINIGGDEIDYTGTTATSFTGCTNVDLDHASGAEVINIEPDAIYLEDSSSFPTSGNATVWIGNEKLTLTSVSNNTTTNVLTATTIARASVAADRQDTYKPSVRFYYAHGRNAPIYVHSEGSTTYLPTVAGAQTGSSIQLNDLQSAVRSDRTIIDQNALDIAAAELIDLYNDPPTVVYVEPKTLDIIKRIEMSDTIRVTDATFSKVSGDYRLKGIRIQKNAGSYKLTLEMGDTSSMFSKDVYQAQKELGNLAVYAQGVAQTITINNEQACQGNNSAWDPTNESDEDTKGLYPLKMEFYIPDSAISINKVAL